MPLCQEHGETEQTAQKMGTHTSREKASDKKREVVEDLQEVLQQAGLPTPFPSGAQSPAGLHGRIQLSPLGPRTIEAIHVNEQRHLNQLDFVHRE